jgi:hypothetical protein
MTCDAMTTRTAGSRLASALLNALGDNDLETAEACLDGLQELNKLDADHPDILVFRSLIAIQRGQAIEALCHMNNLHDDVAPDVKVLCMYYARDPMWEGLAAELAENSSRQDIRQSMSLLLGRGASAQES